MSVGITRWRGVRATVAFVVFALTSTLALLLAAETVVRVKYFLAHDRDWNYLATPFVRGSLSLSGRMRFEADIPAEQLVFRWPQPCVSGQVYSTKLQKLMPRTWDENCFRGDRVTKPKGADQYRIVFVGGSTVQDFQSDEEMMTAQVKRALPSHVQGKAISVVNAGRAGFDSQQILEDYRSRVALFSPDLVVYYEAWNEEPKDVKPRSNVDRSVGAIKSDLHTALHYRSMLYTYFVEKRAFLAAEKMNFWKIDVDVLRRNFTDFVREVRSHGTRLVFVTQVVRMPRTWKGIDTFDYHAVDALIDRLRADPAYKWDVAEISLLNQRLALAYTLGLCRQNNVPVVNIVDPVEELGEAVRADMFMDLIHLTVNGDRIVGRLIGERLDLSN